MSRTEEDFGAPYPYYGEEASPKPHASLAGLGSGDKGNAFAACLKRLDSQGSRCALLGMNVLILLCFIPVWNALVMIRDPVFNYLFGLAIPIMIIAVCGSVIAAWILGWVLFAACSVKHLQNELNFMMIATVFVSALGLGCVIMSFPCSAASVSLVDAVYGQECHFNPKTSDLYEASQELRTLRSEAWCLEQNSVETCVGYKPSKQADVLRSMEDVYKCSGWCSASSGTTQTVERYPPTLFSKSNYQVSCDGMSARHWQGFLSDVSSELHYEGVYLLFVSIGVGFFQLMGLCFQDGALISRKQKAAEYGALSAFTAAEPEPAGSRRYVSQGILY
mmetsp:Transcript_136008/g.290753  ORF Transcript_136008/g.290753 Transcript_136008/m.290753 type:complete len:334 (-) Transcript_136008:71-1072(-)